MIKAEHLSKKFILRKQKPFIVQELLKRMVSKSTTHEEFWALKDVSFEVPTGGALGFIGGNGAGKSTLLSMIIGSSKPTSGTITHEGRIGALLELGAGFHPDLTGRENILLNASLLGLTQAEIMEELDNIIAFTELEEFIDIPIRNYSSGMHVRLGFSVATHVQPDILIVDEALSVGDQEFKAKSFRKIQEMKDAGVTFIVVSHNMKSILDLCDDAIWLDHGQIKEAGPAEEVCAHYEEYGMERLKARVAERRKLRDERRKEREARRQVEF